MEGLIMRKFFVSFVCSMLFVAVSASAALAATNGTDRPLKASGSANGVITVGIPVTFTIDGTSTSTHLGRTAFHIDGVCNDPNCFTSTYTYTAVAANGDTLTASGVNDGTNDVASFTGGTGRFAGASGTLTTTTSFVFDPSGLGFHLTFTQSGTISY
jgi:hypothetical protein